MEGKKRWSSGASIEGYGVHAFVYTSRGCGSFSSTPKTTAQPPCPGTSSCQSLMLAVTHRPIVRANGGRSRRTDTTYLPSAGS
jgi:hypothetical protein